MELLDIRLATFEEVLWVYLSENGDKDDSWEVRNLERANKKFRSWTFARIPSSDIGEIVMPHYKVGGAPIIPETGAILNDAYEGFSTNRDYFEGENSQFCQRIDVQKRLIREKGIVKTIYLSEEPLFEGTSYSGLTQFEGKITHLDGFHRLFALMDMEEKPQKVESYIATSCN